MCDCKEERATKNTPMTFDEFYKQFPNGTPESDKPVKDPDLMFTCLEVADSMRTTESSDEVLAFAKRIYEWVE